MALVSIEGTLFDFRQLELQAARNTSLHRLDSRAKLLVTLLFILAVVSCNRYAVTALLPFFLFPLVVTIRANFPVALILKKVVLVLPFVLLIGSANPFFDQTPLYSFGAYTISGGFISLVSLVLRAVLTVSAAVLLVATTGFVEICGALEQFGMPQALVTQLFFMYRYLFVLAEDVVMTSRARQLRSFGSKGMGWRPFASLLAHLLLRSWQRAERIHTAMLARGGGWVFRQKQPFHFGSRELLFVAGWGGLFVALRLVNLPLLLGELLIRVAGGLS